MKLFIVATGEDTNNEEASHLLVRAENEAQARTLAAENSDLFEDISYVRELSTDGPAKVDGGFRLPV